jgi:hypothetical protein
MTSLLAIRFTVVAFVSLAPGLLRNKGAVGLGVRTVVPATPKRRDRKRTRRESAEVRAVLVWRRRQLTAAGFRQPLSHALALDPRVDLHVLLDLVDRGCPPELAARILAPVEEVGEVA